VLCSPVERKQWKDEQMIKTMENKLWESWDSARMYDSTYNFKRFSRINGIIKNGTIPGPQRYLNDYKELKESFSMRYGKICVPVLLDYYNL